MFMKKAGESRPFLLIFAFLALHTGLFIFPSV
jgi:hypothetical protein